MANPRPTQAIPESQAQQASESTTGLNSSLPSSQASSLSSFGSGKNYFKIIFSYVKVLISLITIEKEEKVVFYVRFL